LLAFADNRRFLGAILGAFFQAVMQNGCEGEPMALTDTTIRLAKAGDVDRKLADEKGLYLLVTATGSKLWRFKYRLNGKEKKLSLGSYPDVGLEEARDRRDTARKASEAGSDPAAAKREARIARHFDAANTCGAIAED
jgi:hypothetical protein